MVRVYVLNVPEFLPLVEAAEDMAECSIELTDKGYTVLSAPTEITFNRKQMKMKPAVWYGAFTGGIDGEIREFGRDEVCVVGTNRPL